MEEPNEYDQAIEEIEKNVVRALKELEKEVQIKPPLNGQS